MVDPPKGIKPNGSKWVFKRKTNMKGNVQMSMQALRIRISNFDGIINIFDFIKNWYPPGYGGLRGVSTGLRALSLSGRG